MNKATACAVGWSGTRLFGPGYLFRTLSLVHHSHFCPLSIKLVRGDFPCKHEDGIPMSELS